METHIYTAYCMYKYMYRRTHCPQSKFWQPSHVRSAWFIIINRNKAEITGFTDSMFRSRQLRQQGYIKRQKYDHYGSVGENDEKRSISSLINSMICKSTPSDNGRLLRFAIEISFEPTHQWPHGFLIRSYAIEKVFCTVNNGEKQGDNNRMIGFALPRGSVKNNMTHVALRGRGTTSACNCLQVCSSNLKFFACVACVKEARPRPDVCSTGALCLATLTPTGDLATSMAIWLSSSLRNENGKLKICVVRTTLLAIAKSHGCWVVGTCEPTRCLKPLWRRKREQEELMIEREFRKGVDHLLSVSSWRHQTRRNLVSQH